MNHGDIVERVVVAARPAPLSGVKIGAVAVTLLAVLLSILNAAVAHPA